MLPYIMKAYKDTLHSTTGTMDTLMMLGQEPKLPAQLQGYLPSTKMEHTREYIIRVEEKLEQACDELQQLKHTPNRAMARSSCRLLLETWSGWGIGEGGREATLNYNPSLWDPSSLSRPTPITHIW